MERLKKFLEPNEGDVSVTSVYDALCKDIAEKLDVDLVAVWAFDPSYSKMTCVHNFDVNDKIRLADVELSMADYPVYYSKIISDIHILSEDVYTDPRTVELIDDYFKVYNIKSLLDYIIYIENKPRAVLCCETVGRQRKWTDADLNYLRMMTVLAGTKLDFRTMDIVDQS